MVATLFVKMTRKVGGPIEGDATEKAHSKWIVVNSVGFTAERTSEQEGGSKARGFGKAKISPMSFESELGGHSMPLMMASVAGNVMTEVLIHQCKASDDDKAALQPYILWKLKEVMVQTYGVTGDSEDIPKESWTLIYDNIECEYWAPKKRGGPLEKVNEFKWDVSEGVMAG